MKSHQYRCNKCLVLLERQLTEGVEALCTFPCPRCGGLAIKMPTSKSMSKIFAELERMNKEHNFELFSERHI